MMSEKPTALIIAHDDPRFPEMKEKARSLYMNFTEITTISEQCNLGLNTVKSWVYGQGKNKTGWKTERDALQNSILKELVQDKAVKLKSTASMTVDLIHGYVKSLVESKEPIDLKTAERLSSMLTNLNKVITFDKDNAENSDQEAQKPTSPEEIRKRLDVDPFSQPQEEPLENAGDKQ
jgi:hypothetical protein